MVGVQSVILFISMVVGGQSVIVFISMVFGGQSVIVFISRVVGEQSVYVFLSMAVGGQSLMCSYQGWLGGILLKGCTNGCIWRMIFRGWIIMNSFSELYRVEGILFVNSNFLLNRKNAINVLKFNNGILKLSYWILEINLCPFMMNETDYLRGFSILRAISRWELPWKQVNRTSRGTVPGINRCDIT